MSIDHETRQHVLLKTLGVLLIAVGISMLSNLWAHERSMETIPAAFEEVFVAGSLDYATLPACLKKNRVRCTSASCVRVSAPGAAGSGSGLSKNLSDERPSAFTKKPCRRICRR